MMLWSWKLGLHYLVMPCTLMQKGGHHIFGAALLRVGRSAGNHHSPAAGIKLEERFWKEPLLSPQNPPCRP